MMNWWMLLGLFTHNTSYKQFVNHLAFIKQHYCISKKVGIDDKGFSEPLSRETLGL